MVCTSITSGKVTNIVCDLLCRRLPPFCPLFWRQNSVLKRCKTTWAVVCQQEDPHCRVFTMQHVFGSFCQIGRGVSTAGAPGFAELVSTEMYKSDPKGFCWIAPDTCEKGATIAFWLKYQGPNPSSAGFDAVGFLTTHLFSPSAVNPDDGPTANAFSIYYFLAGHYFAYLSRENPGQDYFQVKILQPAVENQWIHVALAFSDENGLTMCIKGSAVQFPPPGHTHFLCVCCLILNTDFRKKQLNF